MALSGFTVLHICHLIFLAVRHCEQWQKVKRAMSLIAQCMHKTKYCIIISQIFLMPGYLVYEEIKFLSHLPRKSGLLRLIFSMGTFISKFWKASEPESPFSAALARACTSAL